MHGMKITSIFITIPHVCTPLELPAPNACIMAVHVHLYVYTQNASSKDVKIALVGNKIDLESDRTVSTGSGKAVSHIYVKCYIIIIIILP